MLLAAVGLLSAASLAQAEPPRLVVVLYPEPDDGRPGSILADRGLRSTFASGLSEHIEIHNEYLDVSRFPDASYQQDLAQFLARKYQGRKVDLVIAGLSSAFDFALRYRDDIFPGTPLVFMAVDRNEIDSRKLPSDVVGTPIEMDIGASLSAALRLQPQTRHVYVVVGQSKFDAFWEGRAKAAFEPYQEQVEIHFLTGLPLDELQVKVKRLPAHSLIYYLHVFEDREGRIYMPADVVGRIAAQANAPIYSHVDSYLGRGIVGGRIFSFEAAGQEAATLGLRILAGEEPSRIGIQPTSESAYIFDWREVARWRISPANLPPGSEIRYREPTLWDRYKWQFGAVAALCLMQAALIAGLLVQRSRRERAERRFRQAVDAAPNGMLMVKAGGEIALANQQMERLFGYRSHELIGRSVEMLMPERFWQEHPDVRRQFFAHPESRPIEPMGEVRELWGLRKDGSEFPIEIGLSPLRTELGRFVLASVTDISERRRAENQLRESREGLRQLAGQILGAQEMERRRIARELHDDFGQDLALLSVELDLLRQRSPVISDDARVRMETMSARVKQLSSSIHDLSHQLHPMKLEQLGLVAAIRGLCKELMQNHGLRIEFTPVELQEAIAPDVALCLYRIAQEALRNVVKHSGATSAEVTLCAEPDWLCLVVRDNGSGFDPVSLGGGGGGLGMVSMRERLRLVGGELAIRSNGEAGVGLKARVPLGR